MTGREAQAYIGRTARLRIPRTGIEVAVRIDDWKQSYGQDRFLLVPLAGKGSTWAAASSFVIDDGAEVR